jgi:hypothetical protein
MMGCSRLRKSVSIGGGSPAGGGGGGRTAPSTVNQGANSGFGPVTGASCTGKQTDVTVDVQTNFGSGNTFTTGTASAEGRMFVNFQQVLTVTRQIHIKA